MQRTGSAPAERDGVTASGKLTNTTCSSCHEFYYSSTGKSRLCPRCRPVTALGALEPAWLGETERKVLADARRRRGDLRATKRHHPEYRIRSEHRVPRHSGKSSGNGKQHRNGCDCCTRQPKIKVLNRMQRKQDVRATAAEIE
mmetsp:Transcript_3405/g.8614  ORF Transcript_3405/g.8614 Transcript_3405/m.8614 type:complete len:143 (-) Transcript_3405:17-445(-)